MLVVVLDIHSKVWGCVKLLWQALKHVMEFLSRRYKFEGGFLQRKWLGNFRQKSAMPLSNLSLQCWRMWLLKGRQQLYTTAPKSIKHLYPSHAHLSMGRHLAIFTWGLIGLLPPQLLHLFLQRRDDRIPDDICSLAFADPAPLQ